MAENIGGAGPLDPPPPDYDMDEAGYLPDYSENPIDNVEGTMQPPGADFPNIPGSEMALRIEGWLRSGRAWAEPTPDEYRGVRILSMEGNCIVGLWEWYEGAELINSFVVKQSRFSQDPESSLSNEASRLHALQEGGSRHIINIKGSIQQDTGLNTLPQDVGIVNRIFLEYAPGGNLLKWQQRKIANATRPTENELWDIFHCLARGTLALWHGNERPGRQRQGDLDLLHFDLDQENVMIGDNTPLTDREHRGANIYKLSGFRSAQIAREFQAPYWLAKYFGAGPVNTRAPEQLKSEDMEGITRPWFKESRGSRWRRKRVTEIDNEPMQGNIVKSLQLGTPFNVWKVGLIMYCLATDTTEINWASMELFRNDRSSDRLMNGGPSLGTSIDGEILLGRRPGVYSHKLMSTIRECILVQSESRPSPTQLIEDTWQGLNRTRATARVQAPAAPAAPRAPRAPNYPPPRPAERPPPQEDIEAPELPRYQAPELPRYLAPPEYQPPAPPPARYPQPPAAPPPPPPRPPEPLAPQPSRPPQRLPPQLPPQDPQYLTRIEEDIEPPGLPRYQAPELPHRNIPQLPRYEPPQLVDEVEDYRPQLPPERSPDQPPQYSPRGSLDYEMGGLDIEPNIPLEPPEPPEPPLDPSMFPQRVPRVPVGRRPVGLPRRRQEIGGDHVAETIHRHPAAAPGAPPERRPPRPHTIARRPVGGPARPPPPPRPNLPVGVQYIEFGTHLEFDIPEYWAPSILQCDILENDVFRLRKSTIYLTGLRPDETMLEIKAKMVQQGCEVPLNEMRLRTVLTSEADAVVLSDETTRGDLGTYATVMVDNPTALEMFLRIR